VAIALDPTDTEEPVDMRDLTGSIGFLTRLAQVHTYERFFENLGDYGLRPGEFSTLLLLDRNPGIRQGVLAQALRIKPAHMTKLIRAFEERGLVERIIPDHDRRSVELALTPDGRKFVREHRPAFMKHEARNLPTLTPQEVETLKSLLRKYVGIDREELQ
jgi:DNA-binding MarR family transcriptional regulator